jgi:hypothetical protein
MGNDGFFIVRRHKYCYGRPLRSINIDVGVTLPSKKAIQGKDVMP